VAILRCCDVVNRGAALHKDNVYFGTLDAKLVARNTKTSKVVWRKDIDDFKAGCSYTAAPIIVKGKIITGVSGGEFGVIGWIEAFDAKTGEEVWKFQVGTGVVSSPITWEEDGEQWVGVAAGWGGAVPRWGGEVAKSTAGINQDGSFWAFKLPRTVASRLRHCEPKACPPNAGRHAQAPEWKWSSQHPLAPRGRFDQFSRDFVRILSEGPRCPCIF